MEYAVLNNGVKMPMAGIGTFLLSPDEAEAYGVHVLPQRIQLRAILPGVTLRQLDEPSEVQYIQQVQLG